MLKNFDKTNTDNVKVISNFHTHNYLCGHAFGTVADYVKEAVANGYKTIGISDHFSSHNDREPVYIDWNTLESDYLPQFNEANKLYGDKIEILKGVEVAYYDGAFEYYRQKPLKKITDVYRRFFRDWDETAYRDCLKRFSLDETQRVSQLSAGMRVKYGLALGLSHNARLFIFDEPTSGLDPVARDDLLDLFLSLIEDGSRSILFSTHITSDLDKCADYVTFIKNGRIVMSDAKDAIIDAHTVVSGGSEMLASLQDKLIGVKSHDFGFKALMKTADVPESLRATAVRPDLEDITVYYNR